MKSKAKIKVKVKKRKLNFKKVIIAIIVLVILVLSINYIKNKKITNIYITGNNILTDKEIIDLSILKNYPSFYFTFKNKIKKEILANSYIKDVKIIKQLPSKIYLDIEEYKPICIYDNKIILENGKTVDNTYNIKNIPILINYPEDLLEFVSKFTLVNNEVLTKISEIKYDPSPVDDKRYSLYMDDGNLVYITLSKITKLNNYIGIYNSMEDKKGIIYLDSGDYVELKD